MALPCQCWLPGFAGPQVHLLPATHTIVRDRGGHWEVVEAVYPDRPWVPLWCLQHAGEVATAWNAEAHHARARRLPHG